MGVRRVQDLIAWQLAGQFRDCVYKLVRSNEHADRDYRYRDELFDAVASVIKFIQFLGYSKASLAEAQEGILDGIARGYFTEAECEPALLLAKRCTMAILRLIQSLQRFL